jgi:hypothetical protein
VTRIVTKDGLCGATGVRSIRPPFTSPSERATLSDADPELMLWALSHGWTASVFAGPAPGTLWTDPQRRRFLVHDPDGTTDLPALSDELRTRIAEARAEAARPVLV